MVVNWPNLTAVGFTTMNSRSRIITFWAYYKEYYCNYSNSASRQVLGVSNIIKHIKRKV